MAPKSQIGRATLMTSASFVLLAVGATVLVLSVSTLSSTPALTNLAPAMPGVVAIVVRFAGSRPEPEALRALPNPLVSAAVVGAPLAAGLLVSRSIETVPDFDLTLVVTIGTLIGELGWRGHLYELLRPTLPPLITGLCAGVAWSLWLSSLAWAGVNPLAGTPPVEVALFAIAVATGATAAAEIKPRSIWLPAAYAATTTTGVVVFGMAPATAGTPIPIRVLTALLLVWGLVFLVTVRYRQLNRLPWPDTPVRRTT